MQDVNLHSQGHGPQGSTGIIGGIPRMAPSPAAEKMPPAIAKAIIEAIAQVEGAQTTGKGEDVDTARTFVYSSINDVLNASHAALNAVGLSIIPIEASYSDEVTASNHIFARYGFQFRIVHKDGASWVDEKDTRHISILLPSDGKGAGKAQSLALRDYLKGLLRIRTADPDDVSEEDVKQSRGTERIPPKGTLLFSFGTGLESLTPKEIFDRFQNVVATLDFSSRKDWEEANLDGMRNLHEVARPMWLKIRKALDKE